MAKQPAALKKYWKDRKAAAKKAAKKVKSRFKRKTTTKGNQRKTARKAYEPKRKSNKPKTPRKSVAKKSLKSKIFGGTLGKVALGVGAGTLAGYITSMFVPQFSTIAKPAAAFIAAGPIGLISELVIDQGILGNLGGFLGFNGGGMVAQQEVGGL